MQGLSDVCVCVHADRHMHTYTYETAKETGQMFNVAVMFTAQSSLGGQENLLPNMFYYNFQIGVKAFGYRASVANSFEDNFIFIGYV